MGRGLGLTLLVWQLKTRDARTELLGKRGKKQRKQHETQKDGTEREECCKTDWGGVRLDGLEGGSCMERKLCRTDSSLCWQAKTYIKCDWKHSSYARCSENWTSWFWWMQLGPVRAKHHQDHRLQNWTGSDLRLKQTANLIKRKALKLNRDPNLLKNHVGPTAGEPVIIKPPSGLNPSLLIRNKLTKLEDRIYVDEVEINSFTDKQQRKESDLPEDENRDKISTSKANKHNHHYCWFTLFTHAC